MTQPDQNDTSAAPLASTSRRAWLAAAGLTAAVGGAWWALREKGNSATPPGAIASGAGDPLPADFWTLTFDTPSGGSLALADLKGHPVLINFWATWCPPCVKELPELDRFHTEHTPKGWRVLGLAVDAPTPVRAFLDKTKVGFPVGLAGLTGTDLAASLGSTAGGLPFSVLISAEGRIQQRKLGAITLDELSTWAKAMS
jgi:thiol-disulfide isomerase/thioredoxin